jgi:hypothetical protein
MGKKSKCKSSCDPCYSSSSCDQCYSSSSTYGYCCNKFPKCKCEYVNKCASIYYPNSYVGQYPCNPCPPRPCPPLCPPFPPCPLNSSGSIYTTSGSTTSSTTLTASSPNVNIYSAVQTIQLPAITSLSSCGYTKMFVLSYLSTSAGSLIINTGISTFGQDQFTSSPTPILISAGDSITLYAVYIPNAISYWVVV